MFVIGIVGSPAGGKSTVAAKLEELGAAWINADLIARQVLQEPEIRSQLIDHFGGEIADNEGNILRAKLAELVFGADDSQPAALLYLEGLVHPRTRQQIQQRLIAAHQQDFIAATLDVPLLFKSKWDRACDEIWCIDSTFANRLSRSITRGWDEDALLRREAKQISIKLKRQYSNVILDNNTSLQSLHQTIETHWNSLLNRTRLHRDPDPSHCI